MKKIYLSFLILFSISFAYSLGCCFDSSTGTCSPNSEENTCSGGVFSADATCQTQSECSYGCCTLGTTVLYTRQVTCYNRGIVLGIDAPWFAGTEQQCTVAGNSSKPGACIIKGRYDSTCKYTTIGSCNGGQFYQGLFCSDPQLNTTCKQTGNTTCFNKNVHYLDTCGNVDKQKEVCSYNSGSICEQQSSTIAVCKSLNCEGGKNNGDRWCVNLAGEGAIKTSTSSLANSQSNLFLPFVSAGGEPVCKDTSAGRVCCNNEYCTLNGQQITSTEAENYVNGITPGATGGAGSNSSCGSSNLRCKTEGGKTLCCDDSWDICGEDMCNRCISEVFKYGGGDERVKGCVFGERCGAESEEAVTVGSRYFSQYCLNGNIYTEPCDDFRMGYCSDEETSGKCEINPWQECLAAGNESDSCDEQFCTFFNPSGEDEQENKLMKELGLEMCLPKITGGQEFYPADGSIYTNKEESVCTMGNYGATLYFDHDKGDCNYWRLKSWDDPGNYINYDDTFGFAAIIDSNLDNWKGANCKGNGLWPTNCNRIDETNWTYSFGSGDGRKLAKYLEEIGPDPSVVGMLSKRCQSLGDCAGKTNWLEMDGTAEISYDFQCRQADRGDHVKCTFSFECVPWKAPAGSEACSKCGEDGLPCSEYRCKSLGKGCEYAEPAGADKGYCVSSNDNTAPVVSHSLNPSGKIPPFSSVEITVNTNEDSICSFDLGSAGGTLEDMQYSFDDTYSNQHKVILNVPGKKSTIGDNDTTQYSLITQDGKYNMYVRCMDVSGNFNLAAYLINFEVMDTPDSIPPVIQNITPLSGTYLPFNSTEKIISIKLNEPSECRWDSTDINYALMNNSFSCDTEISDYGVLTGYFCEGRLSNVTLNISEQTSYYIRCKDQPWLEGEEDELYKRNVNPTSKVYYLRPSSKLLITSISPDGLITSGPSLSNFTITAKTTGGAENGKASCKWRYVFEGVTTSYYPFTNTNAAMHSAVLSNKTEGNYDIQVKCEDVAGNTAYLDSNVSLRVDNIAPLISRIFNDKGTMKLFTSEPSVCKYLFADSAISCLFSMSSSNLTQMYGDSTLQHTTSWKKGFTYLIRCVDFYGNQNSECGLIAKAV